MSALSELRRMTALNTTVELCGAGVGPDTVIVVSSFTTS
jgi:hypothetical protein